MQVDGDEPRRISIHAPHARSDICCRSHRGIPEISIHAPHARSDLSDGRYISIPIISIHAPHARSDLMSRASSSRHRFQSTLLMRGATATSITDLRPMIIFQSTLLMRGATQKAAQAAKEAKISIHAPHARSDCTAGPSASRSSDFNPRSSCEERPSFTFCKWYFLIFQSTLLMRGATRQGRNY